MRKDWWRINFSQKTIGHDIENNRKKMGITSFALIGGSITLVYGIFTPTQDSLILRAALIFCAIYLYVIAFSLRYHKQYNLAFNLCGYGITIPMLIIVSSGGYENTGLYWVYPFMVSLFMFLGHMKGLIVNVGLFLIIYWMCENQEYINASYDDASVTRFLASYAVSIFLCFSAEYFRLRSFNRLVTINRDKHKLANTGALTDLPNRRFIDAEFLTEVRNAPQLYFPLAIVLIDLDNFKHVNDTYGHHIGDNVLKHIATCFLSCTRESDLVCRIGGEEFLVLIPQADLTTGIGLAEKMRSFVERAPHHEGEVSITMTISAGVALAHTINDVEAKISDADKLMYQAKRNGRNKVEHCLHVE